MMPVSRSGIKHACLKFLRGPTLILMAAAVPNVSFAASLDITALFRPDPARPTFNTFTNTTPVSGYCESRPAECAAFNMLSLIIPGLETSPAPLIANDPDQRQNPMVKVPAAWKSVTVTNAQGDTKEVQVKVTGFGAQYNINPGASIITGVLNNHDALWGGRGWIVPDAPCLYSGVAYQNDTLYGFFWRTPSEQPCIKNQTYTIPSFWMTHINFSYELSTPAPLEMQSGEYTGSITYSLGPNGDFDFGDAVIPNDSALRLNFVLTVEHILKVSFPPGYDRLALVPDGGWQQWLHRGRRPEKLYFNQPFQISSSANFKMSIQCQYDMNGDCGIQNSDGHQVPVETRVSLPAGIMELTGMAVNRHLLKSTADSFFMPARYVDDGRGTLHFEVSRDSVVEMTQHAGKTYNGTVTIIFDSQS